MSLDDIGTIFERDIEVKNDKVPFHKIEKR